MRLEAQLRDQRRDLALLRRVEAFLRRGEHRAGVHQRRIEERLEEVVAEIVVGMNIVAAAPARVGAREVEKALREAADERRGHIAVRQLRAVRNQERDHVRDRGRVDVAVHVGFTEADVATEHDAPEERPAPHVQRHARARIGPTEARLGTIGQGQHQLAVAQPLQQAEDGVAGQLVHPLQGAADDRHRAGRLRARMHRELAPELQPRRLGCDARGRQGPRQRMPHQVTHQVGRGQRTPAPVQPRAEHRLPVAHKIHAHVHIIGRITEREGIYAAHVVKGGYMKRFRKLRAIVAPRAGLEQRQHIEVPVAEGVVHLGHRPAQRVVRRQPQIEAHGVEDVMPVARRGQQHHARRVRIAAGPAHLLAARLGQRARGPVKVVAVVDRHRPHAVVAEALDLSVQQR